MNTRQWELYKFLKSKYEDKLNSLNKRQEELEKLEKEFSKVNKFYNTQ